VTVTVDRAGRIDVADRGRGVPRKDRESIFKRFWRGAGEKKLSGICVIAGPSRE
jgi:signal transduction histidine kinase